MALKLFQTKDSSVPYLQEPGHVRRSRLRCWTRNLILLGLTLLLIQSLASADEICLRSRSQNNDELAHAASAYLRQRAQASGESSISGELGKSKLLAHFYSPCGFALAWVSYGRPTAQAEAIVANFDLAAYKGLNPEDYDTTRWHTRILRLASLPGDPQELAAFDLDLTADLLQYLTDLSAGRIGAQQNDMPFHSNADVEALLDLIATDFVTGSNMAALVEKVEPSAEGYRNAEAALQHYLALGKTPDIILPLFSGSVVSKSNHLCIGAIVARLKQLEFLKNDFDLDAPDSEEAFVGVVRHFQELHGLTVTGSVDRDTYHELAVPIQSRAAQLALTLERWRWVQHSFPEPPIVINIPEFKLRAFDEERKVALSMRVIVGKAYRKQTPVFQSSISSVIFHPYWNVPRDIQVGEIAPKLAKDPLYLERNGFEVTDAAGELVPGDDAAVAAGVHNGSLKVRQIPGNSNSLGLIKFVFPNTYGVYLHGTPAQVLFSRARRDFSHGCIRAEDPAALAVWVLRHQKDWSRARVDAMLARSETVTVVVKPQIPVLIVYGTAVAEANGEVSFFRDIYGHDKSLQKAIDLLSASRLRQHKNERSGLPD